MCRRTNVTALFEMRNALAPLVIVPFHLRSASLSHCTSTHVCNVCSCSQEVTEGINLALQRKKITTTVKKTHVFVQLTIVQFMYAQMVIKKQRPNHIYSELYIQNVPVNCFTFGRCATLRGEAAHWDTLYIDLDKCSFFARKVVRFL